ncbi:hypothetical protein HIM_06813 [Hirsutella minnesotensis 3608]|uniref:Uncharacterized protein n=1 Tax=Hirsutella minnesotensis 3608 TaxID=1043627 RepID=A0A0F7ZNG2_9HYPO|nr:hypothetical protein HIM_06813 [Hirsutella minnesotensis 3608]
MPSQPDAVSAEAAAPAPRDGQEDAGETGAAAGRLQPSSSFTRHQLFYLVVLDGLGGMALSGGINFAIAYGMYTAANTTQNPIRLFQLPNTLAGDAAVTIIVQCIITWIIEAILVSHDLSQGSVQPIGFVSEPSNRLLRYLFLLPADPDATPAPVRIFGFLALIQHAARGFLCAVVSFLPIWPITIGLLIAAGHRNGGDWEYEKRWTPQVFKLLLGGILGLVTTPFMAWFWLVRAGWEAKHQAEP